MHRTNPMLAFRHFFAALAAAFLLTSCQDRKPGANAPDSAAPKRDDIEQSFALAAGTWDYAHGDTTCTGSTRTISFTPDRQTMIIVSTMEKDSTGQPKRTTYNVLSAGKGKFLDYEHVIRGRVDGETRRTDAGELVVWDLVLATPNRYHWHRTDWPEDGMTLAFIRCDGTRALEQWTPPPATTENGRND